MRHLDEGTIHAWLDGALNEERARQAEEHAARCTQCAVAVADARGYIAASTRILSSLDDVPRGVVPKGSTARSASLKASKGVVPGRRLYQPWMLKVAASIVVVATTALLITRAGLLPSRPSALADNGSESAAARGGPAPAELPASPAPAPATAGSLSAVPAANAPVVVADKKTDALAKAKIAESTDVRLSALQEKPESAAAGAVALRASTPAEPPRIDSAAPAPVANQVATVAPQITMRATGLSSGAAAKRSIGSQDATLPPGMRIVSEQTVNAEARVVQKRVYEVSPGVEVTYSIFTPAPERSRAPAAAPAATDSNAEEKDESEAGDAGVNTIKWSDSTGTDFMLSGRLPLDSLRVIRTKLTTTHAK